MLARLARFVGDLDTAEELAQDTFVAAIEKWRQDGVPDNPAAWLHTTARYLAVDRIPKTGHPPQQGAPGGRYEPAGRGARPRRARRRRPRGRPPGPDLHGRPPDPVAGCALGPHPEAGLRPQQPRTSPVPSSYPYRPSRSALCGPNGLCRRRTSGSSSPDQPTGPERLATVREVIYLVFNEGYSATSGDSWMRPDLCAEALRLGRMLASLTPYDPESLGLLALMEPQASRLKARTGPDGEPVLLMDQDRTRWDHLLIRRGLATLERIDQLGGTAGPYALQAAIAACHARATAAEDTTARPRYRHGKLVEWTMSDGRRYALTGSPNLSYAALATPEGVGNTEVAILSPLDETLFPASASLDLAEVPHVVIPAPEEVSKAGAPRSAQGQLSHSH